MAEKDRSKTWGAMDGRWVMAGAAVALFLMGLVAIWDFSPVYRLLSTHWGISDRFHLVKKQVYFFALGSLLAAGLMKWPDGPARHKLLLCFAALVLLILPLIPEVGDSIRGARRSFHFLGVRIQTGDWGILLSLPVLAYLITRMEENTAKSYHYGACWHLLLALTLLFAAQPDVPRLLILDLIVLFLLFKNRKGLRGKALIALGLVLLPALGLVWRYRRDPFLFDRIFYRYDYYLKYPLGEGFQTMIALRDIHGGGLWGSGLGYYEQSDFFRYLEWDTLSRFVLQIVAREFGLAGLLAVVLLFALLAGYGIRHIRKNPDPCRRTLATAMLWFILLPALLGLIRTLNLLPVVPSYNIPFISYGGQSLLAALAALGMVLAGGKYGAPGNKEIQTPSGDDTTQNDRTISDKPSDIWTEGSLMPQPKFRLWLRWVLATGGGWIIGLGAGLALVIHGLEPDPAAVVIIGGIMAAAQGLILRRTIAFTRWAAGTLLGWYGGAILAAFLLKLWPHPLVHLFYGDADCGLNTRLLLYDLEMLGGGILFGAVIGAGQWLSVRRQWPQAGHWIWASSLAGGMAAWLGGSIFLRMLLNLQCKYSAAIIIPGMVYGAITGIALLKLGQQAGGIGREVNHRPWRRWLRWVMGNAIGWTSGYGLVVWAPFIQDTLFRDLLFTTQVGVVLCSLQWLTLQRQVRTGPWLLPAALAWLLWPAAIWLERNYHFFSRYLLIYPALNSFMARCMVAAALGTAAVVAIYLWPRLKMERQAALAAWWLVINFCAWGSMLVVASVFSKANFMGGITMILLPGFGAGAITGIALVTGALRWRGLPAALMR